MIKERTPKIKEVTKSPVFKAVLFQLIAGMTGFVFAYSGRGFSFSPLGAASVPAVSDRYRISLSLGAATGYVMYCDSLNALRYIAAILCAFVLSKLLCSFDLGSLPAGMGVIGGFCVFATGAALCFAQGFNSRTLLLAFSEGLCAFCISFILTVVFSQLETRQNVANLSLKEFTAYSFFISIVLWSFDGFFPESFSLCTAAAFFLILALPELFSGLAPTVFSVVYFTVFCALSCGTKMPLGVVFGGVCCVLGYFMSNNFALRAAYLLVGSTLVFLVGPLSGGTFLFEAITAGAAFLVIPKRFIRKITDYLSGSYEPVFGNEIKTGLSARLHMASSAVEEISSAVWAVYSGLDKQLPSARSEVFSRVTDSLCSSCSSFEYCWREDRDSTVEVFDMLFAMLKNNEHLDIQNMPIEAKNRCIKAFQLARAFNGCFGNYNVESTCLRQRNEMRRCVAEQFCSVSDIIDDVARGLEEGSVIDAALSERVRVMCFSLGINPVRCVCKYSESGRLKIEIECTQIPSGTENANIKEKLEELCLRELETPVVINGEAGDYITVCEKYPLSVEVGTSQITSNGEKLCGDSVEHFYDGRGSFDVVLADGMGTGVRAALDSAMARGLTGTLLKKGISPTGAIRLVNSALMVKSPEESMSSLDIMQVDMFSGKTEFYKAGAASSFVRHKGRVQEIKKAALPLGILHNIEFASMKGCVSRGDIAVMISDGVADCGEKAIREIIRKNSSAPSERIAEILTDTAMKRNADKRDDLTAVVCKFR